MCVTMNPIQKRITGDGNIKKKKKKKLFYKIKNIYYKQVDKSGYRKYVVLLAFAQFCSI